MSTITIVWIALPFFLGFSSYLLPRFDRALALVVALTSIGYGLQRLFDPAGLTLQLLDHFSVTLISDSLSGFFILTNGLVTAAVVLYCWQTGRSPFFYTQVTILHGSVNAVFICADFMSLYVALEVISIAAFLLIAYPRSDRAIWVGLRYLFVSNTAMLFYLIGAVLVYQATHSFAFSGLQEAPIEAIGLIFLGLLTKGGVFVSGLWLPMTHAEAETPVSALLSGVVIKTGVFALARCAAQGGDITLMIANFSVATALLGVGYAIFEQDTKRTLALSTISQVGFALAVPANAGFYVLTHGLAKACLFLTAGNLPSRKFADLQQMVIPRSRGWVLTIASLSVSGFPLLSGFGAKALVFKDLVLWQTIALNLAAVGTAIVFAKFIFLPSTDAPDPSKPMVASQPKIGFWMATIVLLAGLVAANFFHLETYTFANLIKALVTLGIGWIAYFLIIRKTLLKLPTAIEQFEHLIGMMILILVLLFWITNFASGVA